MSRACSDGAPHGCRARPPPGPRRMRHRQQTPDNPRAASTLARGLRAGMDQLPDCAAALHRLHQNLDAVLARPQPALPPLRPTRPLAPSRRSPRRARPRPHRHLLGLTPRPPPLISNNAVGPTTAVTVGPVRVDIANAPPPPLEPVVPQPGQRNAAHDTHRIP